VICEVSQNIRYQYIFIILWFFLALGIIISVLGLFHFIFVTAKYMIVVYYPKYSTKTMKYHRVHSQLTLREMEYLDKISQMDMTMYGEILRELIRFKPDLQVIKKFKDSTTNEMVTLLPTAPCPEYTVGIGRNI